MFKAPPPNLIESLLSDEIDTKPLKTPTSNELPVENKDVKVNNYLRDRSPRAERSPIHIRKVSPMMRRAVKPTINLAGLAIDSDDEFSSSAKKDNAGENPFDSHCTAEPQGGTTPKSQLD